MGIEWVNNVWQKLSINGWRYYAWEVELEHIPAGLADARCHPVRRIAEAASIPQQDASRDKGKATGLFFTHGVGLDDNKDDISRYFHQIDKEHRRLESWTDGEIKGMHPGIPHLVDCNDLKPYFHWSGWSNGPAFESTGRSSVFQGELF